VQTSPTQCIPSGCPICENAIYQAEVIGVSLDSVFPTPPKTVLHTNNQGVCKVLNHNRPVLKESYWVSKTRESLRSRQRRVEWEKGHVGIRGNELADRSANTATVLPMPGIPGRSLGPWEVNINGEIMYPPTRNGHMHVYLSTPPRVSTIAPTRR